jgi:hypothetical protein
MLLSLKIFILLTKMQFLGHQAMDHHGVPGGRLCPRPNEGWKF